MPLLSQSDLKLIEYSWSAIPPDDPKRTGNPDHVLLNRNEGYEVLHFINKIAADSNWTSKAPRLKVERMIRDVPSNLRSRANVREWIVANWDRYK